MGRQVKHLDVGKLSVVGVLVTMGIVFGNLGTSPLYVMKAIMSWGAGFNELLIYGSLSCIFWTLTLQTTIKYIIIAIRVDNKGEGGILSLFALMRKKTPWLTLLTMVGGAALLVAGILTPAITVTSSVEGFKMINSGIPVVPVVLFILIIIFIIQQFGSLEVGYIFGPIMLLWFIFLGVTGTYHLIQYPEILKAVNPVHAARFLYQYPGGFVLLGAVLLCTTGAEILYADLGQFGRSNIQGAWIFVKISLLMNYFGQGAWLLVNGIPESGLNSFFAMLPVWFLIPGILIAIVVSVLVSQTILSSSFKFVKVAISLDLWPKVRILNQTQVRDQVYLPFVNWSYCFICILLVIIFRTSTNMVGAYSLSIIIAELMTTFLIFYYLYGKGASRWLVLLIFMVYLIIESSFLIACFYKFNEGGWITILLVIIVFILMYGWYFGRKLKNRYVTYKNLDKYTEALKDLSLDETVPRTATNLVYIIKAKKPDQVESKVIYSIFHKQPKRANTYWFLYVNVVDEPKRFEYQVTQIIPGILIRIDFHIGFKVEPKINLYFREVLEDLVNSGEIRLKSSYDSLRKYELPADFKFVLIDRIMPRDYTLSNSENFTLTLHGLSRLVCISDIKALHLDSCNTIEEQVPITINQPISQRIIRAK
jgi:KUP system potassium uptake protein